MYPLERYHLRCAAVRGLQAVRSGMFASEARNQSRIVFGPCRCAMVSGFAAEAPRLSCAHNCVRRRACRQVIALIVRKARQLTIPALIVLVVGTHLSN